MENSYGIGVTNRYALFLDDDADPLEVLKVQEQEKELKKKSKTAEKENKGKVEVPTKGKVAVSQRKPIKETQNQKTHDVKGKYYLIICYVASWWWHDSLLACSGLKHVCYSSAEPRTGHRTIVDNRNDKNKLSNFGENREERNNKRNREERTFNGSAEVTRCLL